MKRYLETIMKDKDVTHISVGWTKGHEVCILYKAFNDEVATSHRFANLDDAEKWLQEEAGTTPVAKPAMPMPLPGM